MSLLFIEHRNQTRAAKLPRRVLIGRRSMNHLVIDDPAVSRMHAWIDHLGGGFYLTDMHSRTGTRVNGQQVPHQQHQLYDGDVIEIGPAKLIFRESEDLLNGLATITLPEKPAASLRDAGVQFDCPQCTAPLWAAPQFAGHVGQCSYCQESFTVPEGSVNGNGAVAVAKESGSALQSATRIFTPVAERPGSPAPLITPHSHHHATRPAASAPSNATVAETPKPAPAVRCGVCQSAILPLEARTTCPSCGLLFHEECWQENYGCSAYGCSQVDALKPPEPEPSAEAAEQEAAAIAHEMPPPRTPWEFILLGLSAVAVLASAVSFGGASLLALVAAIGYWLKGTHDTERKSGPIVGAMALSVVGIAAGVALSYYLFIYRAT